MKKLKNEKGAITILVLVSILFMVSFLISSYVIVANKVKTQKEMVEQTREIYDNTDNMEEIYNSYFANGEVIPIYTVEQLLAIGTEKSVTINGKYYTFLNNDSTIYMLMNDLEFNAYDYGNDYYWTPISDREDLLSGFHGNKHKIEVKYKDSDGDEYSVIYSEENNFSEPEYKVKVSPRILSETGDILSDAIIYTSSTNNEFTAQGEKGEIEIFVKRLITTKVYAGCEGYDDSEIISIYVENPNKIEPINLLLEKLIVTFSINAAPVTAKVIINGTETNSAIVNKGDTVTWKVEAENYIAQEGTQVVNTDTTLDIDLSIIKYSLTIVPTPSDATVTISSDGEEIISGTGTQSVNVNIGTNLSYSVEQFCYYTKSNDVVMNDDHELNIALELKPEEEPMILTPSRVSAEDWTSVNNANSDIDSSSYASSWNTDKFYFYFDASAIDENAKITSIVASYQLGQSVPGNDVNVILDANGTQCLSITTESIPIVAGGKIYEVLATTLPTATDVKTGLTLSINNTDGGADILRIYGARLTITYINP